MSSRDIFNVLELFDSTKIRERNEALDQLTNLIDSDYDFTPKNLTSISESLFSFIDNEIATYRKHETPAALTRLCTGSYTLRKLITKKSTGLKFRLVEAVIEFIQTRFFTSKGDIFHPLAVDLSKTLHSIVVHDAHRDHLSSECWVKLVGMIIRALHLQFKTGVTDKFLPDLLRSLKHMLKDTLIEVSQVTDSLSRLITQYFDQLKKEDSLTPIMLEIANQSLILMSTTNVSDGLRVVNSITRISSQFVNTNYEALKDQYQIFFIISSEYIGNNIPKLIDEDDNLVCILNQEFREFLVSLLDSLLQHYVRNIAHGISIDMIKFSNTDSGDERSWINFQTIMLKDLSHIRPWITLLGLVSLLNSLFTLEKITEKDDPEQVWKRRKLDNSFVEIIGRSSSSMEFVENLLESTDTSIQQLGLQLLTFHIHNFCAETDRISLEKVFLYDKPSLTPWVSLCIRSLLEYGCHMPNEKLTQALRINIQMLKDPRYVDLAAQTIIQILCAPGFVLSDRSVVQLLESVFEISEINGPTLITNDSLKFWVVCSDLAKVFSFADKKAGDKIVDWLLSKWNTLDLRQDLPILPHLINWICGSSFVCEEHSEVIDCIFTRWHARWASKLALARRILRNPHQIPEVKTNINWNISSPVVNIMSLEPVLEKFLNTMNSLDGVETNVELVKCIGYGLSIYESLTAVPELLSPIERIKYDIRRLLENIKPTSNKNREDLIRHLNQYRVTGPSGLFVIEYINDEKIFLGTSAEVTRSKVAESDRDFAGFGTVRKATDVEIVDKSLSYHDLRCTETTEQLTFKLILKIHSNFETTHISNAAVDHGVMYLGQLPPDQFCHVFYTLLESFKDIDVSKIQTTSVKLLLRHFGMKVLSDYSFQRSPIGVILIARFSLLFSRSLLIKGTGDLINDFADIFEWYLNSAKRGQLTDEYSLSIFLSSLFELLSSVDTLHLGDPSVMTEIALQLLKGGSNFTKVQASTHLVDYLESLPWKKRVDLLDVLIQSFVSLEVSDEVAASLMLSLENLSSVCYPFLIRSLSFIIRHYQYPHFRPYAQDAIGAILRNLHIKSLKELPSLQLLELFDDWFTVTGTFDTFPFSLLGYSSGDQFMRDHYILLYSIVNSKVIGGKDALSSIMEAARKESDILQLEAMSWLLPLSYTHDGLRNEMNKYLGETLDETLVEYQAFVIIHRFLQLVDVSDEREFFKHIIGLDTLPYLNVLVSEDAVVLYPMAYVSISFSDAVYQISQLANKKDFWTPNIVLFLVNNLLKQVNRCFNDDERILCLRRLKLVLILGYDGFKSDDVLLQLVNALCPYLMRERLHMDVSKIITTSLRIYPSSIVDSKLYPSGLFNLFHEVSEVKESGKVVDEELAGLIIDIYTAIDSKRAWKGLFSPFIDVLNDIPIRLTLDVLHRALKYASQVSYNLEVKKNIIRVMTLIFSKKSDLGVIPYGFTTSKDVAQLLLNASKLSLSNPVASFIAKYLGRFFLETGNDLQKIQEDFERSIEYDIEQKSTTLNVVFDEILVRKLESTNLDEIVFIDEVLGNVLYQYNKDPSQVDPFIEFEKHLGPFAQSLSTLDSFLFNILNPYNLEAPPIGMIVEEPIVGNSSLIGWTQAISISLLNEIKQTIEITTPIISYLSLFPSISPRIVNHLWILYVRTYGHSAALHMLKFIVNSISYVGTTEEIDKEKVKLILNLCYFVRICARENMKHFTSIYKKLELVNLYELATYSGLDKFALLLFEEYHTSSKLSEGLLAEHSAVLTNIYEGLGDTDLLFGLPVDPSLDYAINIFNKTDNNAWKRVMFNSAAFDASVVSNNTAESRGHLLKSLASSGLNGLSHLVNDFADPIEKLSNNYEWCWKLDKWDIPVVADPQNENEFTYNVLKSVKDHKSTSEVQEICQNSMIDLLKNSSSNVPLLKTLCSIYNVETIIGLNPSELSTNILDFLKSTDEWFKFSSFATFENLLLSRKIVLESLQYQVGQDESVIAAAHEVVRYGELSRLHNEHQRSANASVILKNVVSLLEPGEVKLLLSKVSNLESACTLWSQGETVIPIAMLEKNLEHALTFSFKNIPPQIFQLSESTLRSYLVKWNSESRQKRFETIMEEYVELTVKDIVNVPTSRGKADVYHKLGYFCYKHTKESGIDEEIKKRETLLLSKKQELRELKAIIQNKASDERDKKEAKRYYHKLVLQFDSDKDIYDSLQSNKKLCIQKAIEFFLKTISVDDKFDQEDVDKLCALWLEYSDQEFVNDVVESEIVNVPTYKFIPWINQLVSRLSNEASGDGSKKFQAILQEVLVDICYKHPYHGLYYIKNLEFQKNYEISLSDKSILSRIDSASNIWSRLKQKSSAFAKEVLLPIDYLAKAAMELANFKISKSSEKKIYLENLAIGEFWLKTLPTLNIPLPTMNHIPISLNGDYSSIPRISSVYPHVSISPSGISLPKILKVTLNDGSSHRLLLKGGTDDLRQDSIMEQVFEKVNIILQNDKMTRKRNLRIRTYKVVPLGPTSGMIEFVADSIALSDVLRPLHRNDKISFDEARVMMKNVQAKSTRERISTYMKICKDVPPAFRVFFYETFVNVDDWYNGRQVYTKGIVTTSIVGYVLGLGDRHLNNILIDKKTGEPVHIDLGVAFDQGKLLPIPENVPFRLTRDLVDGLGVTGVKGSFEKSAEHLFRVLRENVERIISILDVLKYDPLYIWAISPIRKRRLQDIDDSSRSNIESDDSDAGRAVKGVEEKLIGNGLSVEATVQQLIQEATDVNNLAVIYLGWSPFY